MTHNQATVDLLRGARRAPWQKGPLAEWAIVGMNHYHINGERRLFVAMVKGGRCIKEEGPDDIYLWNRLCHQVWKIEDDAKGRT